MVLLYAKIMLIIIEAGIYLSTIQSLHTDNKKYDIKNFNIY